MLMAQSTRKQPSKTRYVLIIEDNVHHAEILTEVLDRHFAPVVIHTVDTVEDGIEFAGQSSYDLILTGAVIRETPVTDALVKIARLAPEIPIVVISGKGDERLAAELIKRGAAEYLVKTRETLEILPEILKRHIGKKSASRKERPAKRSLKQARQLFPSSATIVKEVDKLTQQALTIVGTRHRKSGLLESGSGQLEQLLGQIKKLRSMASKLKS
jgi:DNA-binding NtrC family response regulator